MDIADVHKNTKLLIDGVPHDVEDVDFVKPGKGRAIYRMKMRNMLDGSSSEHTYHSGDKVEEAHISLIELQYLYKESDHYVFMNSETFEQYFLSEERLGNEKHFLKEGTVVTALMMEDSLLNITLPRFVELKVREREVVMKKETFSAQTKAAVLETGFNIEVPGFIKEGDIVKIDTRAGTYVERVSIGK